ncbi:Deacetoxyvindoline 4-hydroxylase [Bertholletia excelsa]
MVATTTGASEAEKLPQYDRKSELKASDNSKAGVKGLVDGGLAKIPWIFIHDRTSLHHGLGLGTSRFNIPITDLAGPHSDVVNQVKDACKTWGFFQVINHGMLEMTMEEMLEGVRRFHKQDTKMKKQFYSRDVKRSFIYNSNFDLYKALAANWRDTFACIMAPETPAPEEQPTACRDILIAYSKHVMRLGLTLLELFPESLGHDPACPEPDLTLGISNHADNGFFTILLQDKLGGLQILHEGQWVDVPPLPGALVVNIADLLQAKTISGQLSDNWMHSCLVCNFGKNILFYLIFLLLAWNCEHIELTRKPMYPHGIT